MRSSVGIVLLEGADSSGKTTLARYFVEKYNASYLHSTIRKEIWRWHVGAIRLAIRRSRDRLVVLDRLWLSELVYGAVFRGGPAYDVGARCLDRVLRRFGAVTVLCAPRDLEAQERRWTDGRAAGKHEHFNKVREVIASYADLRDGNVAHGGHGYLDQLIRYGDFTHRDDVLVYDLDKHPTRQHLATFAGRVVERANFLRDPSRVEGGDNLAGRIGEDRRGFLLVGEEVSPRCRTFGPRIPRWPFCDDDRVLGSATWLNRALHAEYAREDRFEITNAYADDDRLPDLLRSVQGSTSLTVIALGKRAAARVRELGCDGAREVPHPQWHRRFHYRDGPEGYGKILREAMT